MTVEDWMYKEIRTSMSVDILLMYVGSKLDLLQNLQPKRAYIKS